MIPTPTHLLGNHKYLTHQINGTRWEIAKQASIVESPTQMNALSKGRVRSSGGQFYLVFP